VWSNFKLSADTWNSGWSQYDNNGLSFAGPPAAAEFNLYMINHTGYTALAEADANGVFYVRVSNTPVGGAPDWTAVPNGVFLGQPALAVSPSTASFGPKSTLFLAGLGTDNRIWVAQNTLVSGTGVYSSSNWSGFSSIGSGTFQTAPAITWACPQGASQPVAMMTALGFDNQLYVSQLVGATWSAWTPIPNGTFAVNPPAIATSCTSLAKNTLVLARGTDSRIWYAHDNGTGSFTSGFTPIGTQTFTSGPGAAAVNAKVSTNGITVAATTANGQILSARITAP
jgi:hypothetical protein